MGHFEQIDEVAPSLQYATDVDISTATARYIHCLPHFLARPSSRAPGALTGAGRGLSETERPSRAVGGQSTGNQA